MSVAIGAGGWPCSSSICAQRLGGRRPNPSNAPPRSRADRADAQPALLTDLDDLPFQDFPFRDIVHDRKQQLAALQRDRRGIDFHRARAAAGPRRVVVSIRFQNASKPPKTSPAMYAVAESPSRRRSRSGGVRACSVKRRCCGIRVHDPPDAGSMSNMMGVMLLEHGRNRSSLSWSDSST